MGRSVNVYQGGFSLVELMVALLILAVLVGIAVPNLLHQREQAMDAETKSLLVAAERAQGAVRVEQGTFTVSVPLLQYFIPDIDFSGATSEAVHVVLDGADADEVLLYARSRSGAWFGLRLEGGGRSTCQGSAEADMALGACMGSEW